MVKTKLESTLVEVIDNIVSERFRDLDAELDDRVRRVMASAENPEPLMTRKEVASFLGCSLVTVHELMKSGKLPFVKLGASTRFHKRDVERLAKAQRRAAR